LKQTDFDGSYKYSRVIKVGVTAPTQFSLDQNYPNPFNPSTRIKFSLSTNSRVTLKIFDILGGEITTLINKDLTAGPYNIDFNASGYPSGVYFCRLRAEGVNGKLYDSIKKMLFIK
jgi:hypothetical protein